MINSFFRTGLFLGYYRHFSRWILTHRLGVYTWMVAQLQMNDATVSSGHWFKGLSAAGFHGLVRHSLCHLP